MKWTKCTSRTTPGFTTAILDELMTLCMDHWDRQHRLCRQSTKHGRGKAHFAGRAKRASCMYNWLLYCSGIETRRKNNRIHEQ